MKKQISADLIAYSRNTFGDKLATFVITIPRIVLAELNTHRMFSRNSASSRAIPFEKMVKMVEEDPFIPMAFQKDHKGMQGTEYLEGDDEVFAKHSWLEARDQAVAKAKRLAEAGVTKQLCNRLLEPFMWHTVIVTASEYENFFHLRCPQYEQVNTGETFRSRTEFYEALGATGEKMSDLQWLSINKGGAEIHIARVAELMYDLWKNTIPKQLAPGEWHIPFGDRIDDSRVTDLVLKSGDGTMEDYANQIATTKVKIATARCARVSYMNYEGKDDYEADIKLYDRLSSAGHWSPFEHCAEAMGTEDLDNYFLVQDTYHVTGVCGNFTGFKQLRKTFAFENVTELI